jgi:hypothetical protein
MTKSNGKSSGRHWKRRPKVLKARYDENSQFAAFDVVETSFGGKQRKVLTRGTFEGIDPKLLAKMLMHMTETFACSKGQLDIVPNPAPTTAQVKERKGQQHV